MKKLKNKEIVIPINLLEHTVRVIFTPDINKYVRKHPEIFGDLDTSKYLAFCFGKKTSTYCVLPNESPVSLVSHEISHAVDDIMFANGLNDGEIKAIITQYLMRNIYE